MRKRAIVNREPGRPAPTDPQAPTACCVGLAPFLDPRLFKALGDRTRVEILARLASGCGARSVSEVAAGLPVDLSVVSRHLAQLRDAGIVRAERRGREVAYSVLYPELARSLRALADALERCCPEEGKPDSTPKRKDAKNRKQKEEGDPS